MDADAVLRGWSTRTGEYSPGYYAHHGPNATSERLRSALESRVGSDAAVLELGCSAGRHLAHLRDHGFTDLHGIDVNEDAAAVLGETYPELAADGTFYFDAIEAVVPGFEDDRFDAVFSVQTLQHVHPDHDWVFEEVARVTGDVLMTVELEWEDAEGAEDDVEGSGRPTVTYINDDFPLYRRDWERVFGGSGWEPVEVEVLERGTLRVFRDGWR